MKRVLIYILIIYNFSHKSVGQITFDKTYSVDINTLLYGCTSRLILLPDSGYAFATTSYDSGNNSLIFGKINKLGAVIWIKQIDDANQISTSDINLSPDGFLYLTTSLYDVGLSAYKTVVAKFDLLGNLIWSKSYGNANINEYSEHVFTTATSVYITGESRQTISPYTHFLYILKLNTTGTLLWGKIFNVGDKYFEYLRDAKQLKNNDILLSGVSMDSLYRNYLCLFMVDTNGVALWNKRFNLPTYKEFHGQAITEDLQGNIIVSGRADTISNTIGFGFWDIILMKLSQNGSFKWAKLYGGADYDETYCVSTTSDNGFIMAAEPESFGGVSRISLLKTDSLGNTQWMRLYGKNSGGFPTNIVINYDKGYTVLAKAGDYGLPDKMILIRTDSVGKSFCKDSLVSIQQNSFTPTSINDGTSGLLNGTISFTPTINNFPLTIIDNCAPDLIVDLQSLQDIRIFPNPFSNSLSITILRQGIKKISFCIRNALGQQLFYEEENNFNPQTKTIDLSSLSKGIYFFEININGSTIIKKVVKQ